MAQGNAKKPQTGKATPQAQPKQNQQQKQQQQQQKQAANQQKPKVATPNQKQATPPPPPKSPGVGARGKLVIWADDNDVDLEDITFAVPIILCVVLLFVFFLRKYIRWTVRCQSDNRIDGKTVVITGANSGIGKATVTELAKRGAKVILGCRDRDKGEAVSRYIRTKARNQEVNVIQKCANSGIGKATATELAKRGAKVILGCRDRDKGEAVSRYIRTKARNQEVYAYKLDLASLTSIKDFVDEFSDREPILHVLINNAAYMGPKATTVDGFERSFGVNYLGHFYLTNLLFDKLKRGAPSRVINVVSDSYTKGKLDFGDLAMVKYDIHKAYGRSKLAMMLFNSELHRRFSSSIIFSYGVHPGYVCTDLLRNWPGLSGNILRAVSRVMFKSPDDGCQTIVHCAVADKIRELSGKILENCDIYRVKNVAKDKDLAEKLWNTSLHLCGMETIEIGQNGVKQEPEVEQSKEEKKEK